MSHDCIGCPYATPAERRRTIRAFEGALTIDLECRTAEWSGVRLPRLTEQEFLLFSALAVRPGVVMSGDRLLLALYGDADEPDGADDILKLVVLRVRRKLQEADTPLWIETLWGTGYALTRDGPPAGAKPRSPRPPREPRETPDRPRGAVPSAHLTPQEDRIMSALLGEPGRIVSHKTIREAVWWSGPVPINVATAVAVLVKSIRGKLLRAGSPLSITTHRGTGYALHDCAPVPPRDGQSTLEA